MDFIFNYFGFKTIYETHGVLKNFKFFENNVLIFICNKIFSFYVEMVHHISYNFEIFEAFCVSSIFCHRNVSEFLGMKTDLRCCWIVRNLETFLFEKFDRNEDETFRNDAQEKRINQKPKKVSIDISNAEKMEENGKLMESIGSKSMYK